MSSEIAVNDSIAITLLFWAVLFLGKSMYDLIKSRNLSRSEKVKLALVISFIPLYGSLMFYFYERNNNSFTKHLRN